MNCIKCGVELTGTRVFCDQCRAEMEHYPVPPETAVHIPYRPEEASPKKSSSRKKPRKKPATTEEQLRHAKTMVIRLSILVAALALSLIAVTTAFILHARNSHAPQEDLTGKDYGTYGIHDSK